MFLFQLNIDFTNLYSDHEFRLLTKFEVTAKKVLKYCSIFKTKDKAINNILKDNNSTDSNSTNGKRHFYHKMFVTNHRIKVSQSYIFIYLHKTHNFLTRRQSKLVKTSKTSLMHIYFHSNPSFSMLCKEKHIVY